MNGYDRHSLVFREALGLARRDNRFTRSGIGWRAPQPATTRPSPGREAIEAYSSSDQRFREAPLNARKRRELPDSAFALPDERRYPIDTAARARSALARARVHDPGLYDRIRRAVKRRYPDMNVKNGEEG